LASGQVLVSVVIPVRNGERTVAAAVRSMCEQTHRSLEIVVVDDGSTDDTAAVVLALRDARVRVVASEGRGLVAALNTGVAQASGAWIARMDADDVSHPSRIEEQLRVDADVIGCGVRIVNGGEGYARYATWLNSLVSHEAIMRERFVESPLAHPTVMMRTSLLRALGGYRDLAWPEDYDLWLRFAASGARFGKASAVLLDWTDHPERTSRRDPRYSPAAFLACKAHFLRPIVGERCTVWGAGPVGSRLGRALRENAIAVSRFVDIDLRKIGNVRGGSRIVSPDALTLADAPVLSAVAARGARDLVRQALVAKGFVEGLTFWCAA
jgi:glycosyltransferase involved in cell wall biosynthesis